MRKWPLILTLVVIFAFTYFGCKAGKVPTDVPPVQALTKYLSAETCTTCHVAKGNEWSQTKHFSALPDLLASDHVGDHCFGCHVTGLDDNPGNSGYDDPDPSVAANFGGVQCEKCHGPGGEHIQTFEPLSKPLGSWMCGECHDGSHHNTYSDWQGSMHAVSLTKPRDENSHFSLHCLECHSADYRFADSIPEDATIWDFDWGITCVVCHDPHSEENEHQLRKPVGALCGECHTAGGAVPGQSPHHSTADVLFGSGGYEYPGEDYTNSYHTLIEDSCAACHMFTAPYVSEEEPTISGHTFEPEIEACQECHPGLDTFDRDGKQTEIAGLLAQLDAKLDLATDADKEGLSYDRAKFNYGFINSEGSSGIHNYKYAKKLLMDSLNDFWPGGEPPPPANYVGSQACSTCHSGNYNEWIESGHPYKLNKAEGGPPTYPWSTVPNTPSIATWADVTYVIGGYFWKARFIGTDGYIITGQPGDGVQYNLADGSWAEYHPGEQKPYNCGKCHTTGWQTLDDNGGVHQDGLEGIEGTWTETGIGCEGCHGPGSDHIAGPSASNITKDTSASLCGNCHTRDGENRILVKGDLVRHHEQYDEFLHSPHSGALDCISCHDPHAGVVYDDLAAGTGVTKACTDCHSAASHQVSGAMSSLNCTDCHMPLGAKSALSSGTGLHLKGDIHNHIFAIDSTGVALDGGYFDTDGSSTWIAEDGEGMVKLNLAWACMQCHDGNSAFQMTDYGMAAGKASGIHN